MSKEFKIYELTKKDMDKLNSVKEKHKRKNKTKNITINICIGCRL